MFSYPQSPSLPITKGSVLGGTRVRGQLIAVSRRAHLQSNEKARATCLWSVLKELPCCPVIAPFPMEMRPIQFNGLFSSANSDLES